MRLISAAAVVPLLISCSESAAPPSQEPSGRQPAGWSDAIALVEAEDSNPNPDIVEVQLTAKIAPVEISAGRVVDLWTYNGSVPGPLIRAKKGDRVIVHFENQLPEASTIHWHGLRIPAEMDGVPHHSQPEVSTGGQFTYDFVVSDAGLFWYHPHFSSAAQVGFGLYAPFLVEDPAETIDADELIVVLSDVELDEDDVLSEPTEGGDLATLFGREGNVVLVNGKNHPKITVRAGAPQRWRIVNAAKSRYFYVDFAGHSFRTIGVDGGRLPSAIDGDKLLLIPGQRAEVLLTPQRAGELRWIPYDRGYGSTEFRDPENILTVALSSDEPFVAQPVEPKMAIIEPRSIENATPVQLTLTRGTNPEGKLVMGINGVPSWEAPPIHARVGETQVWTVENAIEWSHPFHLHGFFFQELDDNFQPVQPLAWRDTIDVPVMSTRRIAVRFDERPGMWMFHCHVLDHADAGMMGMVHLTP